MIPLSAVRLTQLRGQNWRCAYPCGPDGEGAEIKPGDKVAVAFDGTGIIHLDCAWIGNAPTKEEEDGN